MQNSCVIDGSRTTDAAHLQLQQCIEDACAILSQDQMGFHAGQILASDLAPLEDAIALATEALHDKYTSASLLYGHRRALEKVVERAEESRVD